MLIESDKRGPKNNQRPLLTRAFYVPRNVHIIGDAHGGPRLPCSTTAPRRRFAVELRPRSSTLIGFQSCAGLG